MFLSGNLISFQVLSLYRLLLGVLLQLHCLLPECLLQDLQILLLLLRDQGHGLMYRGLDDQVGTPIEDATVFKATGESSTSLELDISQYLSIMICYLPRKHILYSVQNYKLVDERCLWWGLSKSAASSLYNLFYITLGVLMAAFAPVTSQLAWLPSV